MCVHLLDEDTLHRREKGCWHRKAPGHPFSLRLNLFTGIDLPIDQYPGDSPGMGSPMG